MLENVLFLIGVIVFFFVPYFIFYLKGISLKVLLPILTVSIVVMLFTLPDKYDFIGGVILYLWCYLVIIGVFKLFNYRIGFARVVRRCMIDPSDKDIYKLGRYIKNRRITYKWAKKRMPKAVIELMKIHHGIVKSSRFDPHVVDTYLLYLTGSGFIEASESNSLTSTFS